MTKVALLIGVSEYESGLNPLPAAVKDVAALKKVLSDSELGEFDEVNILTNPDCQEMREEIETLFSGRKKDDFVLLFFSGHGIKDDHNNLYFANRITRKNQKGELIRSTAVRAQFIHEVMNNSRAKRQVLILDCCFSGAFDPALQAKADSSVDLQNQLGAEGRVVLTSSSSTQYSFEQEDSALSLYTRYLIEGIETGAGDLNEDGKISTRELHDYATSKVQETAPNMTPKLITLKEMGFDIVLAKAKVTDPQSRYRKQVERYASHGQISSIGRTILNQHRNQLEIELEVSQKIETEVLKPYQERLKNLQRYRQMFSEAIEHEYPLSVRVQSELQDLREILGLRREDIASIEQDFSERITQKSKAEKLNHQHNLQKYKQEFKKAIEAEYPLANQASDGLKKLQQSLGLKDEDIEPIERPIVTKKKAALQKNLEVQQTVPKRKVQTQTFSNPKYRRNLARYEQEFRKAVEAEYPLSEYAYDKLSTLRGTLELKMKDVETIENLIFLQTDVRHQNQQKLSGIEQLFQNTAASQSHTKKCPDSSNESSQGSPSYNPTSSASSFRTSSSQRSSYFLRIKGKFLRSFLSYLRSEMVLTKTQWEKNLLLLILIGIAIACILSFVQ